MQRNRDAELLDTLRRLTEARMKLKNQIDNNFEYREQSIADLGMYQDDVTFPDMAGAGSFISKKKKNNKKSKKVVQAPQLNRYIFDNPDADISERRYIEHPSDYRSSNSNTSSRSISSRFDVDSD